jgi:hypothetical protein
MLKYRTVGKDMTESQWKAAISQRPKRLLASNGKLAKANIHQFSIPAAAATILRGDKLVVMKTCPMAGDCLNFCYAQVGSYAFKASLIAHTRNLQYVLDAPFDFADQMIKEIQGKRKVHAIRIHDSGDTFSRAYFMVWKSIMEACPSVQFYAYTKMVPLFKKMDAEGILPDNFTVIYSQGGKFDHLIDKDKDRHSHVFATEEACIAAGYVLNEEDDMPATDRNIMKIGLVVHGPIVYANKMNKAVAEHNA